MGNCQAIDAAALVIQHPSGRLERLYWSVTATEIMKRNPGHYVSLIIPLPAPDSLDPNPNHQTVQFTRVKLLRPTDTLTLGHAYRLVTTQEVVKVLRAKKYAKMKKPQPESAEKLQMAAQKQSSENNSDIEKDYQAAKHERHRSRTPSVNSGGALRSKSWQPSLQSISEAVT